MTINHKEDVQKFHDKFGPFTLEQQQAVVEEEAKELAIAILQGDVVAIARECVDLIYAVAGIRLRSGTETPSVVVTLDNSPLGQAAWILRAARNHEWIEVFNFAVSLTGHHGIPLPEAWAKVHAANMRKERNDLGSTPCEHKAYCVKCHILHPISVADRDACNCGAELAHIDNQSVHCPMCYIGPRGHVFGKPTKPPGWVGPDVAGVMGFKSIGEQYIMYECDDGAGFYDTEQEALAHANNALDSYREEAESDGEWLDGVNTIVVAKVQHYAKALTTNYGTTDYSLSPADKWLVSAAVNRPGANGRTIIEGNPCDNLTAPEKVLSCTKPEPELDNGR